MSQRPSVLSPPDMLGMAVDIAWVFDVSSVKTVEASKDSYYTIIQLCHA